MAKDSSEVIIDTLKKAGEPLKTAQIAEKSGLDAKEVGKLIKTLKVEGKITSPKNCYYSAS